MKKIISASVLSVGLLAVGCSSDEPSSAIVDPIVPDAEMKQCLDAYGDNAIAMFSELYSENVNGVGGGNVTYSPLSFSMALGMIANGAEGETLSQINQALTGSNSTLEEVNRLNKSIVATFPRIDRNVTFSLANSFWYDKELAVEGNFADVVKNFYGADVRGVELASASPVINAWVRDKTKGYIKEIYDDNYRIEDGMVLVNALHYQAPWINKFKKENTRSRLFYNMDGTTPVVQMMKEDLFISYVKASDATMITLPMGGDKDAPKFSMSFILPEEGTAIKDFVERFTYGRYAELVRESNRILIALSLPKFKVEQGFSLKSVLEKRGVTRPFDKDKAEFGGVFPKGKGVCLSEIKQKIFFEIDEDGAKGAAVTHTGLTIVPSLPVDVNFDRPFVYLLTENATGAVVFVGTVSNM